MVKRNWVAQACFAQLNEHFDMRQAAVTDSVATTIWQNLRDRSNPCFRCSEAQRPPVAPVLGQSLL